MVDLWFQGKTGHISCPIIQHINLGNSETLGHGAPKLLTMVTWWHSGLICLKFIAVCAISTCAIGILQRTAGTAIIYI